MDATHFTTLANQTLSSLADTLESSDFADSLEIDLVENVLQIELENGQIYIINKHGPTQQIWLSSPLSGASYFVFSEDKGMWENGAGKELFALMQEELSAFLK